MGVGRVRPIQRIDCCPLYHQHDFTRAGLFHSLTTVEGRYGNGLQRRLFRILRAAVSRSLRALSRCARDCRCSGKCEASAGSEVRRSNCIYNRRRLRCETSARRAFARDRLHAAILEFYSSNEPLDRLAQLKGKRIAVGPVGSATRFTAEQILGKGGVNAETATFLHFAGLAADKALKDGQVDAVWIIRVPEATAVQSFLRNPNVRLMSFPTAEAFTRIFPDLIRLVLPQGVVDIDRNIPPADVQLIATTSKILIRSDVHPEIVQLLLQTMKEVHSGSGIFRRSGEFPNGADIEYTVAPTTIDFYKNGPSFMQRHLPLWMSVHVQRAIAVLVTGIAIGFPLFRFLPQLYNWMTRRRVLYWYGQLKALEDSFETNPDDKHLKKEKQAEIERIEDAVSHIRFPLTFSDQVYNLRSHIDISTRPRRVVRRRCHGGDGPLQALPRRGRRLGCHGGVRCRPRRGRCRRGRGDTAPDPQRPHGGPAPAGACLPRRCGSPTARRRGSSSAGRPAPVRRLSARGENPRFGPGGRYRLVGERRYTYQAVGDVGSGAGPPASAPGTRYRLVGRGSVHLPGGR